MTRITLPTSAVVQLELALNDVRVNVPWEGRSPRVLTRAAMSPIFKAQAAKARAVFTDPAQCEMWRHDQKGPLVVYQGAPLLLPLGGH